jgi:hypothetical protein
MLRISDPALARTVMLTRLDDGSIRGTLVPVLPGDMEPQIFPTALEARAWAAGMRLAGGWAILDMTEN